MELKRPNLVVVGGQHPPEVMGRRGLQFFIEEILAANALSKNFRDKFNVIAIPMINETGIALGHWRHNTRGVDSNRDWAPGDLGFQSPETRALRNLLNSFDSEKNPHVAFFDFHSTYKITAYAPDSQGSDRSFLECFEKSVQSSNPKFKQWAPRWFSPEKYNSIGFMWSQRQYKIPSIAIEFDDNMDLSDARKFAQSLANSSMALLLNPGSCSTKK